MKETLVHIICILGSSAVFLAALGLLRLPDFFTRAHAATKASAFGLGVLLLAFVAAYPSGNVILKSVFAVVALFLTLPVGSQALSDAVRRKNDDRSPGDDPPACL